MAFASLRQLAFAAVFSAAALAANGALAAGAAPEPDRTMDMATVLKPGPLPELTVGDAIGRAGRRIRLADLPPLRHLQPAKSFPS